MSGIYMVMAAGASTNASLPTPLDVFSIAVSPSTATSSFTLNSNGAYTSTPAGVSGTWKIGGGLGSSYEARLTVISGSFSGGSTGVWLSLGSDRTWSVSRSTLGSTSASGTLEIRDATSGIVFTSSTLTLTAEVDV